MRYTELSTVERIDPRAVYGRPWSELTYEEQLELMGFHWVRTTEEIPEELDKK